MILHNTTTLTFTPAVWGQKRGLQQHVGIPRTNNFKLRQKSGSMTRVSPRVFCNLRKVPVGRLASRA